MPTDVAAQEIEWDIAGRDGKAQRRFVAPPRDHGWTVNQQPLGKGRAERAVAGKAGAPKPAASIDTGRTADALLPLVNRDPLPRTQGQLTDYSGWGDVNTPWRDHDNCPPSPPAQNTGSKPTNNRAHVLYT
jgi:hypothetical protein